MLNLKTYLNGIPTPNLLFEEVIYRYRTGTTSWTSESTFSELRTYTNHIFNVFRFVMLCYHYFDTYCNEKKLILIFAFTQAQSFFALYSNF